MGTIIALIFVGVFSVAALLLVREQLRRREKAKQVQATLDSALATESREMRDQIVNLRKNEQFSAIPWLNNSWATLELGPQLQALIHQANLKWTRAVCSPCAAPASRFRRSSIHWKTGSTLIALAGRTGVLGLLAHRLCPVQAQQALRRVSRGLPEACDLMVSALRAGQSLIAAMGLVARECTDPLGIEFRTCFEEQNFGLDLKTAPSKTCSIAFPSRICALSAPPS